MEMPSTPGLSAAQIARPAAACAAAEAAVSWP